MAYRTGGFGFGGFTLTPMVKKLLFANFGMFLITWLLPPRFVLEWLAFRPDHVLTRPWGALTYMFVHADLMHVLFNMLVVFFSDLRSRAGGDRTSSSGTIWYAASEACSSRFCLRPPPRSWVRPRPVMA